ncbi:PilZ domain-containing protein [Corallococcus interemptor]|uniref:PilZ domain-containing protein n=1 Tax=Corallococcus TaxID=83461 RepID=UPI001CBB053A|nr:MULTISPECIES: PilZ domain-containing protein [unclassified Corallococcus]MBZ4329447.1 PilZ domain-containing protein [Corallococcus sp. AS-1-12]MBZ4373062.1 PilZ domain-containing protein [Corallococcus sp. AS-1-6]
MSEKRKANRAPLDIYLNKYMGGVPYMTRAADISQEGVSLSRLIEPQHDARRVGLQFQLPGSEEIIYAEGEVVREWKELGRKEQSGVRFTLLTERHRKMIDAYVDRHSEGN